MQKISLDPKFPQMRRIVQKSDSHCAPAVLSMLISFHQIDIDQEEFVKAAGVAHKIKEYGMTISEMRLAINSVTPDFTFWYKDQATSQELDYLINNLNYPVGVEWQGIFLEYSDDDDGHYAIITAIDIPNNKITLADPFEVFAHEDRTFRLDKFLKRWWDVSEIVNPATGGVTHQADDQMMFIITPNEATFPIELGMKKE